MAKCPKCGREFDESRGALSRRADIIICSGCGTAEAMTDWAMSLTDSEDHKKYLMDRDTKWLNVRKNEG